MAYTTIDDPSAYFQTLTYTGNGANNRALVNDGNSDLQPDWIWYKRRDSSGGHTLIDSSRGVTKILVSHGTNGDQTENFFDSFDSNGFTVDVTESNVSSATYVAWQWKVNGGTTTTNDASVTGIGDIDSVIQANTEAGFSIVLFDLNGDTGGTAAHGLGAAPDLLILKNRENTASWNVMLPNALGNNKKLTLDSTDAEATSTAIFLNTAPTSTVFSFGGKDHFNANAADNAMIAYCFKSIQGYSKFGSYVGNGNADGTFVYTGFKPAWVMVKRTDSSQNWIMYDNKRNDDAPAGANVINRLLYANASDAEVDTGGALMVDFLSNGFKMRGTHAASNGAGSHIYIAIAESPFVSSKGVPTTAR